MRNEVEQARGEFPPRSYIYALALGQPTFNPIRHPEKFH